LFLKLWKPSTPIVTEIEYIPPPEKPVEKTLKEKLLEAIEASIGFDVTPKDEVPDEVACVSSLCAVLRKVMDFPKLTYTPDLLNYLKKDKRFKSTLELKEGSILVNATGTGNGSMRGHCGFVRLDRVVSNNSFTGKMDTYYTLHSWKEKFRIKGGMTTWVFELISD
jgi:hypothetical protein